MTGDPGATGEVETEPEEGEQEPDFEQTDRWRSRPWLLALAAFLAYLTVSILLWGIPALAHFSTRYIQNGRADADFFRWALAWTPWALTHGQSPLYTHQVFAPNGVDMSWTALMPGPAIVMWPVTKLFGTLVTSNALKLLSPALAGWGAYLVCNRVTKSFWPSLLGGYLFGFSAYMVGQMQQHLNLVLIFPVPILVYLVIRRVEGSLGVVTFVALASLTLLGLFSISTELFATTAFFGAFAVVIALIAGGRLRMPILRAVAFTCLAYVIVAAVVFVPYLLPVIRNAPASPVRPLDQASADLYGFIVPRTDLLVGGHRWAHISSVFTAKVWEDGSYIGFALVAVLVGFAITERRRRETWALLAFVLIGSALALGPVLHVRGRALFAWPAQFMGKLPLIKNATAQRLPMYTALAIGVIAAIWLARAGERFGWARWLLVVVGALSLLPYVHTPPWYAPDRTPTFFTDGTYRSVLHPNENVFVITGTNGEEMMWQSVADFAFRMPEGYIGVLPPQYQDDPLFKGIAVDDKLPIHPSSDELATWLHRQQVTALVLGDLARSKYESVIRGAGLEQVYEGGGVTVWRVPSGTGGAG